MLTCVLFTAGTGRWLAIVKGDPVISVEESEWGIKRYVRFPDGKDFTAYFGMPNINYLNGQVVDADIKRADVLIFKVPVDHENHIHFEVRSIPFTGDRAAEWLQRRRENGGRKPPIAPT